MDGEVLRDDQWEWLKPFVPGGSQRSARPTQRRAPVLRRGVVAGPVRCRWRDLPEDRFGPYQTVKRRYYRWIEQGIFDRIFDAVATAPDMAWLSIDATVIRAQAQAAGGRHEKGERKPRLSVVPEADLAAKSMQ